MTLPVAGTPAFDTDRWPGLRMEPGLNEWYLFHGTRKENIENIMKDNFTIKFAGKTTGKLYGDGCYFAESITKADEYAEVEADGLATVMLCRALGGRVRVVADDTPDPQALWKDVLYGDFDSVIGDRRNVRGTYREFVIYDIDQIYPEF